MFVSFLNIKLKGLSSVSIENVLLDIKVCSKTVSMSKSPKKYF